MTRKSTAITMKNPYPTGKRKLTRENWNEWVNQFKELGGQKWNDDGIAFATENNLLY